MDWNASTFILTSILAITCVASYAAVLPMSKPSMAIKVEAGEYNINGQTIAVSKSVALPIDLPERVHVRNEEHIISDEKLQAWAGGTSLNKVLGPVDKFTRLPNVIVPGSVKVHLSIDGGTVYNEGKDYVADPVWGGVARVENGSIPKGASVHFDYEVFLERIDTVQISKDGVISIKKGISTPVCAEVPKPDAGCAAIASVYVPYRVDAIKSDNIFPVAKSKDAWKKYIKTSGGENLKTTLDLLKNNKPVNVVCWGDSVTEGASPSSHDKCYVELFRSQLTAAYPNAKINLVNAGIGGSNTDSRRDGFEKEVLSYNPDLITVKFVNDLGKAPEQIKKNFAEFIARARAKNPKVEFVIITPHFVMREWLGTFDAAANAMREAAAENHVALADTSHIWANLHLAGIPYDTLLANGINHPNNLGHQFFADSLMDLLASGKGSK